MATSPPTTDGRLGAKAGTKAASTPRDMMAPAVAVAASSLRERNADLVLRGIGLLQPDQHQRHRGDDRADDGTRPTHPGSLPLSPLLKAGDLAPVGIDGGPECGHPS